MFLPTMPSQGMPMADTVFGICRLSLPRHKNTSYSSSSTENGPNREGQKIRSFIHKGLEEGEVEISKNRSDNKMKML